MCERGHSGVGSKGWAKSSTAKSQNPRRIAACAPLHLSKEAASCAVRLWFPLRSEPCRQALGSHSSQRRPWRRRPEELRAKACRRAPTTFTKDAGQRAAHRGAVPGHPRELTGLDQNRDIDDALLRGGLRLAEAEFRPTQGRRVTGWEFGATGHRRRSSAGLPRTKEGQCGHE